ncbi:hypothetical protein ZIOFF_016040 [Zingiber officinale]|uniref:Uncharacterized protein n=1 Tax=Zingiber officinale TaxID=94328 RepID=A0A8J5LQP4_ZINOF|nr:hypothetical protein ZIOFF_016040 [Zingiber officinale]
MQSQNLEAQFVHMDYGSSSKRAKLSVINPMDCVPRPVQLIQYRKLICVITNTLNNLMLIINIMQWSRFPEIHLGLSIKGKKQV